MEGLCNLEIEFDSSEKADFIIKSIKVDDFDYVYSRVEKNKLIAEINSKSISSLLHTIDDYLACISVACKVLDKD